MGVHKRSAGTGNEEGDRYSRQPSRFKPSYVIVVKYQHRSVLDSHPSLGYEEGMGMSTQVFVLKVGIHSSDHFLSNRSIYLLNLHIYTQCVYVLYSFVHWSNKATSQQANGATQESLCGVKQVYIKYSDEKAYGCTYFFLKSKTETVNVFLEFLQTNIICKCLENNFKF